MSTEPSARDVVPLRSALRLAPACVAAAVLLFAAGLTVTSCAAPRTAAGEIVRSPATGVSGLARPAVPDEDVAALRAARKAAGIGRRAEAANLTLALLARSPSYVEADRFLQDLLSGTVSDAWLRQRYAARLAASPHDADALYLAGRIEPSRARQADLFDAALAAEPFHPWARIGRAVVLEREGRGDDAVGQAWLATAIDPRGAAAWYFLGVTALSHGAPDPAVKFLHEAAERVRDDPRPWLGIASAHEQADRADAAAEAAVHALRVAPGDPATIWTVSRLLERADAPGSVAEAVRILAAVSGSCGDAAPVHEGRGRLLLANGEFRDALAALEEARKLGTFDADTAVPVRRAKVALGRARDAVDEYAAGLPFDVFDPADRTASRWSALRAAAGAGDRTAADALALARALTGSGWLAEASDVYRAAKRNWPGDDAVRAAADEHERFAEFLADVAAYARGVRRRERAGERTDLDAVVAKVTSLARDRGFGGDLPADGGRARKYAFLGRFAASSDADGPFGRLFERRGLLFLAGQRSGQGAELMAGRVVSSRRVRAAVLGSVLEYDEHVIEGDGLPEAIASIRGGLAGLTLDHDVFVHLDVSRRGPPREEPGLPFLAVAGEDDDALRSLATPSEPGERISRSVAASVPQREFGRLSVDAVVRHERVHVLDASRLVPVGAHPFAAFFFALSHGFSGAAMERTLEARAAVGTLAECDQPRLALAALTAFLPSETGETPHVAAYRGEVARIVDEILRDPAAFPSIDRSLNVAQQFDRLTDDECRELGRRLLR